MESPAVAFDMKRPISATYRGTWCKYEIRRTDKHDEAQNESVHPKVIREERRRSPY